MIHIERDEASAAFFDGTRKGVLLIRRCSTCGAQWAPQVTQCARCFAEELDWSPAAGIATLVSWSVPRDRDGAVLAIAGLVELAEGPWLRGRIVGATPDQLAVGMRLIVRFRRSDGSDASRPVDEEPDGEIVPVFEPVHNQES